MQHLSNVEMNNRGDVYALVRSNTCESQCSMCAFVWMDRERRYFVATGSSLNAGSPYVRQRWRQVNEEDPNADAEKVQLIVPQPQACEVYYSSCAKIDRHNRCRQDDLNMEKKFVTHDWEKRFNMSVFSMCVVDTWLAYNLITQQVTETQHAFYMSLAEELIDNKYDDAGSARNVVRNPLEVMGSPLMAKDGTSRCGLSVHVTPTKRKRKRKDGSETIQLLQGSCRVCKIKTTHVCSACNDEADIKKDMWICHPKTTRLCFAAHVDVSHLKM